MFCFVSPKNNFGKSWRINSWQAQETTLTDSTFTANITTLVQHKKESSNNSNPSLNSLRKTSINHVLSYQRQLIHVSVKSKRNSRLLIPIIIKKPSRENCISQKKKDSWRSLLSKKERNKNLQSSIRIRKPKKMQFQNNIVKEELKNQSRNFLQTSNIKYPSIPLAAESMRMSKSKQLTQATLAGNTIILLQKFKPGNTEALRYFLDQSITLAQICGLLPV